jgi:hypothetical protein
VDVGHDGGAVAELLTRHVLPVTCNKPASSTCSFISPHYNSRKLRGTRCKVTFPHVTKKKSEISKQKQKKNPNSCPGLPSDGFIFTDVLSGT